MKIRPYSVTSLVFGGVLLMGLGLYFIFVRPPLLPEDPRYMGASLQQIETGVPGLALWLKRVFWVMGGFMIASGALTCHVALTSFRARARGAVGVVIVSGLASIGWMALINFIIASDFKWLLLSFTLPWIVALLLYRREQNGGAA